MKKITLALLLMASLLVIKPAFCQYRFFDGNDWNALGALGLSKTEEKKLKMVFLKSAYETSLFNGAPVLALNPNATDFLMAYNTFIYNFPEIVDIYYSKPSNRDLPLFYALHVAEIVKNGGTDTDIQGYYKMITDKLKSVGIIGQGE
ncbi:MAG: hypothetical protein MUF05_03765 [Candidatus Omnitrophica bacterium]|jgi:hypothetical protein|nr:hypothetical protein [Candidatus Omnitrophota bacterium]